jgi:phage tail tube protein FII
MRIPNHVANYSIFLAGRRLIGLADVTLPNMQNLTDTFKGSGIFGEIDMPVQCHFQAMSVTLNWNTIIDDMVISTLQEKSVLDAWAAIQEDDPGQHKILHSGWRFVMGTAPKTFNLGKLEVGTKGEAVSEYELISIRAIRNDVTVLHVDKENAVCRWWNGNRLVDYGARIRQLIGM